MRTIKNILPLTLLVISINSVHAGTIEKIPAPAPSKKNIQKNDAFSGVYISNGINYTITDYHVEDTIKTTPLVSPSGKIGYHNFGYSLFLGASKAMSCGVFFTAELFAHYTPGKSYMDIFIDGLEPPTPSATFRYGGLEAKFSYGGDLKFGIIVHHIINLYTQFGIAVGGFKLNEIDVTTQDANGGEVPRDINRIGYQPGVGVNVALTNRVHLDANYTWTLYKKITGGFNVSGTNILTTYNSISRGMFVVSVQYYLYT